MRALITGSTGFIGYHLVKYLLSLDWELKCLVRKIVIENRNLVTAYHG